MNISLIPKLFFLLAAGATVTATPAIINLWTFLTELVLFLIFTAAFLLFLRHNDLLLAPLRRTCYGVVRVPSRRVSVAAINLFSLLPLFLSTSQCTHCQQLPSRYRY